MMEEYATIVRGYLSVVMGIVSGLLLVLAIPVWGLIVMYLTSYFIVKLARLLV